MKSNLVDALCTEIDLRYSYLSSKTISTLYFGGGTPSLLNDGDFHKIFHTLSKYFHWNDEIEITIEANPDDIYPDSIEIWKKWGFNRLSIGIQSFWDVDLKFMNRAHDANEAESCIKLVQDKGIGNLSIDLIYGSPTTTQEMWIQNVQKAIDTKVPHISSYCLTIEEKTVLHHHLKTKKIGAINQDLANQQFKFLMACLSQNGYDHYEISNFCKPNFHAIHNTNYWMGTHYLGLGPSAHSFNGIYRSWNIAHNKKYIDSISAGQLIHEEEYLSEATRYNEYIMTRLRTIWGINIQDISNFNPEIRNYFSNEIKKSIETGFVQQHQDIFTLTEKGKYFADRIAMDLFWVE